MINREVLSWCKDNEQWIVDEYRKGSSVSQLMNDVNIPEEIRRVAVKTTYNALRHTIIGILKSSGIYEQRQREVVLGQLRQEWFATPENIDALVKLYETCYSVSSVIRDADFIPDEICGRDPKSLRPYIEKVLRTAGVYWAFGSAPPKEIFDIRRKSKSKMANVVYMERYGVANFGEMSRGGWGELNKVPARRYQLLDDFTVYRDRVNALTKTNRRKIVIPQYCYYTGILFADNIEGLTNPNDHCKRSLDHKQSIMWGFLNGLLPEDIADTSNLVYCLRYANTIKQHMSAIEFMPFAKLIRERFINEGCSHN